MFKWEPVLRLYAQPHDIQRKIGRVLMGSYQSEKGIFWVSHYMHHINTWSPPSLYDLAGLGLEPESVHPAHFMLIEPLPE